jgi:hypothetical protein
MSTSRLNKELKSLNSLECADALIAATNAANICKSISTFSKRHPDYIWTIEKCIEASKEVDWLVRECERVASRR